MTIFWLIIIGMLLVFLALVCRPLRQNNKLLLTALLILPVATVLLYLQLGASDQLAEAKVYKQRLATVKSEIKQLGTRSNVIKKLKQKIKQQPDDAKGWFLLGKLYFSGGEFELAAQAFNKANDIEPGNVDNMLGMAMAQFYADGQRLTNDSQNLLSQVLALQKDNINALNLLALGEYNQQHYTLAAKYWEQILPQFPADSEDAKLLLKLIAKAQVHTTSSSATSGSS